MFNKREYYYDTAREIREIKKKVPYSINEIGSIKHLEKWKKAREGMETTFHAKRQIKIEDIKIKLAANYVFDSSALGLSEASKRYKSLLSHQPKSFIPVPGHVYPYFHRYNVLEKTAIKCLEWFLKFQF